MRILAISGSLRASSTNTSLLRAAAALAPENMHIALYEDLGDLPHFSPELDDENSPESVRALRAQLQEADGVLICTPEYAFGVPGSLKNALDWTVSSGDFYEKPTAVISASATGGERALASLLSTLTALTARVPQGGTLSIRSVRAKVNVSGEVTDPETVQALKGILEILAQTINA